MSDSTTSVPSPASASRRIAVIGLGNMGGPMAASLVKAGHHVGGFDLLPAPLGAATATWVTMAATGTEAVRDADVVLAQGDRAGEDFSPVISAVRERSRTEATS